MGSQEVLEEKPVSLAELREDIKAIKKRDGELNFRGDKLEDYLNHFSKFDLKKTKEIIDKINDLNVPRLKEQHVLKIVDIMPLTLDDLKSVLQGYTLTVTNENLKKIMKVLDEYRK